MALLKLPTSYSVCVSPSGRYVAALGRNVVVADLLTNKRVGSWHATSHPSHAAFSPDDSLLAVKSTWGEVVVIESATGEERQRSHPKLQDEGASIHFSRCGRYLVDGSWSGHLRVRRVDGLEVCREFTYRGEMICAVSRSANADVWLIAHLPRATTETHRGARPYLTVRPWPLRAPERRIEPGFDDLYAVELAPDGQLVAVYGHAGAARSAELRVLSLDGKIIASAHVAPGGTGHSLRWSPDSRCIGVVAAGEFRIFQAPMLAPMESVAADYPSDLAFIRGNTAAVLGTWTGGRIHPLSATEG